MSDLNKEALDIWGGLKPMIDQEISSRTQGMVQRRKAKVTTAPSLATNTIGVTEAFGQEIFLPFVSNMISAKVGDFVWIEWMYGATNAFVSSFAAVDDKNFTVAGVLDVVPRRCYATLSSAGWYRVMHFDAPSEDWISGDVAFTVDVELLDLARQATRITLFGVLGALKFANEQTVSHVKLFDKIRYTKNGTHGYIDVYFNASWGTRNAAVHFVVNASKGSDSYPPASIEAMWNAVNFTPVADSPSGETVLTTHNFVSDNSPVGVTNSSNLLTSGTIASSGSMSYTATVPCWVYLMFIMQANSNGSINVQIDNVNIINWSSGEAVPVNFSFLPIPLMTGNTLYVAQSSNRASIYSIFAMR